jgi:hypothetical protein
MEAGLLPCPPEKFDHFYPMVMKLLSADSAKSVAIRGSVSANVEP